MTVKSGSELCVFVFAYGRGSVRNETKREIFWNHFDDYLQSLKQIRLL